MENMRRTPDGLLCFLRAKSAISRPLRSGYPRRDEEIGLGQRATKEKKKYYYTMVTEASWRSWISGGFLPNTRSMERSMDRRFEPRGSRREFFSVKISLTILRCKAEGKSLERLTALCNPMCLGGLNRAKQFYSPRVHRSKALS